MLGYFLDYISFVIFLTLSYLLLIQLQLNNKRTVIQAVSPHNLITTYTLHGRTRTPCMHARMRTYH